MYESGELAEALGVEQPAAAEPVRASPPVGARPLGIENRLSLSRSGAPRAGTLRAMPVARSPTRPCAGTGGALAVLDQTLLPGARGVARRSTGADDTAAAIRRLAVRGAPLIGIAAAYGLAMEVARAARPRHARARLGAAARRAPDRGQPRLRRRPRARRRAGAPGRSTMAGAARAEAQRIHAEEDAASAAIARARRRPPGRRAARS